MIRRFLPLLSIALATAFVGAQGPKALMPQQRAELYKKNRPMIERLVEKTVESSRTPSNHLKRADSYYKVLFDFSKEIKAAREANDADRVAELTNHLTYLLDEGLAPTLGDARAQAEDGTSKEDYEQIRDGLLAQVAALLDVLNDRPEGEKAKKSLEGAKTRLHAITGPKKK
jgi:hypothetical protein